MSKHDHPAYHLSCCKPWLRGPTPSGRMERVHRFNCPVAPNQVVEKPSRAELAKHAIRSADDEAYEMYWRDRDDDEGYA